MLGILKRNPFQWILLHQIAQIQLPFLPPDLIRNGSFANPQTGSSPFTVFFFSSAASNSRRESRKTEDPLIEFFRSYGFTDTQCKRFLKYITVRSIGTNTVRPKLEHLMAFGFSPSELIRVICYFPIILSYSLKERIEPNLSLLEATFGTTMNVIKAVNRGPWLLGDNLEKVVIPNLNLLRENSIPVDKITHLFTHYPLVLRKDPGALIETISKLKGMGMRPSALAFIHGITAMATFKKETWESKMKLYETFGWLEKDTLSAFARQPMCIQISEEKIKKQMELFTEKLQWDSAVVLRWPVVLLYSLENRVIPRCAVLNVLAKNGLWNGKPNLNGLLNMAEKDFKERFVEKYGKEVLQVIDAYQGKVEFVGFDSKILSQSQACVGE